MPAFPLHGWMPDAYRSMPLPALAVFSGVVSKVAAYGFLRIVLPLFPAAAEDWQMILLVVGLLSILYGSIQAFTQTNAGSSSATRRWLSSGSSRSGSSRWTTPPRGRRARCCRRSTTGWWWRRCS